MRLKLRFLFLLFICFFSLNLIAGDNYEQNNSNSYTQSIFSNAQIIAEKNTEGIFTILDVIHIIIIGLILFFFRETVKLFFKKFLEFLKIVPLIVYQKILLLAGIFGIIRPDLISEDYEFYIALFSAFSNILIVMWIFLEDSKYSYFFRRILMLGGFFDSIFSFYLMVYFTILAFIYESSVFGLFATIFLANIVTFGIHYLARKINNSILPSAIFAHLLILTVYLFTLKIDPENTAYFHLGFQYYCPIVISLLLLIGSSPFLYEKKVYIIYSAILISLTMLSSFLYLQYDLTIISSILFTGFILLLLQFIVYFSWKRGINFSMTMITVNFFILFFLYEKYGSMITFKF